MIWQCWRCWWQIIIISVIMFCFGISAVWIIQDFYGNKLFKSRIVKWWNNGDGCSGDSCALILALREWIMRLSLLCPLSLPLPLASGQNIAFPPVALWVTVGLAVCLLVLLIALAAVCRRKIKESCEEARREGRGNGRKFWGGGGSASSTPVYILTRSSVHRFIGDDSLENPCLILRVK